MVKKLEIHEKDNFSDYPTIVDIKWIILIILIITWYCFAQNEASVIANINWINSNKKVKQNKNKFYLDV